MKLLWLLSTAVSELRSMADCLRVNVPVRRAEKAATRSLQGEDVIEELERVTR